MFSRCLVIGSLLLSLVSSLKADDGVEEKLFTAYSRVIEDSPAEKDALTPKQMRQLFLAAYKHPVADVDVIGKYDPKEIIGFCFGRSTTVHLIARQMGLKDSAIRKLFIIGDLRSNPKKPEWRFHVTTLVKGPENQWYAIDPIMTPPLAPGGELKVEEWIKIVKKTWDYKKKAYLYVAQASAITPDIRKDADGKTGDHVVELSFNPEKQKGFKKVRLAEFAAYVPSQQAQSLHFLEASAGETENRFLFLSVTIEGMGFVSFNDYFVELLKTFNRPIALAQSNGLEFTAPPASKIQSLKGEVAQPPNLHSFRLGTKE